MENICHFSLSVDKFGLDLHRKLFRSDDQNIICSPLSLALALSMLSEGARLETLENMKRIMYLPEKSQLRDGIQHFLNSLISDSNDFTIVTANKAFVSTAFNVLEEYQTTLQNFYNARMTSLDFDDRNKTADIINNFVRTETRERISHIISASELDPSSRIILINTLFFKSKWMTPFRKKDTYPAMFYSPYGVSKECQMMKLKKT